MIAAAKWVRMSCTRVIVQMTMEMECLSQRYNVWYAYCEQHVPSLHARLFNQVYTHSYPNNDWIGHQLQEPIALQQHTGKIPICNADLRAVDLKPPHNWICFGAALTCLIAPVGHMLITTLVTMQSFRSGCFSVGSCINGKDSSLILTKHFSLLSPWWRLKHSVETSARFSNLKIGFRELLFRLYNYSSATMYVPQMPIRYASLKLMLRFENPSVAGPEFQDKRKCGRPKCERGRSKRERRRYVSKAAPRFGNLCVYEPSALRKKPSDSSEKTFWFSEEAFRFAAESRRKRISERRSESRHQF